MPPNTNRHESPVRLSQDCVDSTTISTSNASSIAGAPQEAAPEPMLPPSRSVNHFDTDESLLEALMDNGRRSGYDDGGDVLSPNWKKPPPAQHADEESMDESQGELNKDWDWTVELNEDTSYPQTVEGELNRLKALRSYHVLDSERDASFERLTALASRMFDVPICLVSLVDLGRQWFLSNRGLGDLRETPRKIAFCAHTIMSKEDLLIVEDATKDDRFKENPVVLGPPHIRFYAGAPLVSPEGYKLGTLCLIDYKTRPGGLDLGEKQNLTELAALVVDSLVKVRHSKEASIKEKSAMIACTAHDMLTPLNGVELSLSLLMEERDSLEPSIVELVETASSCCDIMSRTCQHAISQFRHDNSNRLAVTVESRPSVAKMNATPVSASSQTGFDEIVVAELVKNIQKVLEHFPKLVPVCITVDQSVPPVVISDDLKLFRCALNFLTNACQITTRGSVNLQIRAEEKSGKQVLVFECSDTGPGVHVAMLPNLFKPVDVDQINHTKPDYEEAMACIKMDPESKKLSGGVCHPVVKNSGLGLYSVATSVRSLNGDYGFHPQEGKSGAVFWFHVPLLTSPSTGARNDATLTNEIKEKLDTLLEPEDAPPVVITDVPYISTMNVCRDISNVHSQNETESRRSRRALVIDDSVVIRKSINRALQKMGFSVIQAADGMQGLKELQQGMFDLVLCDFLMPVMDGLDCIHQYRAWEQVHRPLFRQFVVGISAHASEKDIERGKNAGMDDFVSKPVKLDSLKKLEERSQMNVIENSLDILDFASVSTPNGDCSPLESQAGRLVKKRKQEAMFHCQHGEGSELSDPPRFVCLIAESSPVVARLLSESITRLGDWNTVIVHDGQDALRLLKMRQYDAVFLNEDTPVLNAAACMERFRQWEDQHRVSRQGNMILLSSDYIPASTNMSCSTTVYPDGFAGALGKPICLTDLQSILYDATQSFGQHNIVTS